MNFKPHFELQGKHAFLSPSQPYWLRYDYQTLEEKWDNRHAQEEGTAQHALCCELIKRGWKLASKKTTIGMYVNDCIKDRMFPETVLYYSDKVFGTADAISYDEKNKYLRIYDLKTGVTKPHREQLLVYAALFCLEYKKEPEDISIECRIYQNDEIDVFYGEPEEIRSIINTIVDADDFINKLQSLNF